MNPLLWRRHLMPDNERTGDAPASQHTGLDGLTSRGATLRLSVARSRCDHCGTRYRTRASERNVYFRGSESPPLCPRCQMTSSFPLTMPTDDHHRPEQDSTFFDPAASGEADRRLRWARRR